MKLLSLILAAILCITATPTVAQNYDANAEPVSGDYLLLRSLRGVTPIGDYAVTSQPLSLFRKRPISANHPTEDDILNPSPPNLGDAIEQFRRYIVGYYSPLFEQSPDSTSHWLEKQHDRYRIFTYADNNARVAAELSGMMRGGTASFSGVENQTIALAKLSARAIGSLGENFGFMLDLSNGQRISGLPLVLAQTDPVLGRTFKFVNEEQKFFDRYIGYVQYQNSWMRASFGRQPFGLGFSPIDNLLHSRNAPLFDALLLDIPYKSIRFTSIHGAIEGVDTAGHAYLNKYVATHRLTVTPADWIAIGITDMIVYSGRGLDFAYLNPLGFYVSTGLGTPQKSAEDNSLLSIDVAVRPWQGGMFYGTLLADDISFSTITDTSSAGNNNKYAWQIGVSQMLDVAAQPLLITAEYVRVNAFVYSHRMRANSWTHLGAPLGYDIQPNSDRLAIQGKYWFSPRTSVQLDMDYTRHGENYLDANGNIITADYNIGGQIIHYPVGNVGGDALRGDGDFLYPEEFRVGNRFLRGNVSYMRRVRLGFSSELYPNIFTDLRLHYQNINGGNTPGERFWATLELRVGY